jgi:hypothetical protein
LAQSEAEKEVWNANKEAAPTAETFDDSAVPFVEAKKEESSRAPQLSTTQIPCPKCKSMNPDNAEKCSNCQTILLLPCDSCHKMISAFAEECEYCHAKYKIDKSA